MAAEKRSSMADFTIQQSLGKGSYGSVYKVIRKVDGQPYAIKEVNIRKLAPREREDALNEIRILASIKHKNIVRYCDAFVEKDNLYIVMEFAEHGDISRQTDKFKKANKYIKEDTIWSYFIQICQALNSLHSRNVLHRDIKPKNVFLTGKNHVRLGDLGCAKLMKSGMARTQIGTPYYMSPEIWNNRPYDVKSDVWALGCLVYELAMLAPPFLANDMNGLAAKIKTTAAPRVSKHYSEDLGNLVASMLAKDPRQRPDIKAILAHPAMQAKMHTVPEDEDGPWAGEEMRSHLIATIKVPPGFGFGVKGGLNLPAPNYPRPAALESVPESAAEGGAGSAAPAAAPSAFAAATSPSRIIRATEKENAVQPAAAKAGAAAPASAVAAAAAKRPLTAMPTAANAAAAPAAIPAKQFGAANYGAPYRQPAAPVVRAPVAPAAVAPRAGVPVAAAVANPRRHVGVGIPAAMPGGAAAVALGYAPGAGPRYGYAALGGAPAAAVAAARYGAAPVARVAYGGRPW